MSANPESVHTSGVVAPLILQRLITVGEVRAVLRVSRQTVYNLVARGQLKPVKIGSALRFRESDILTLVNGEAQS